MSKKKTPAKTASKGSAAKAKTLLTGVVKKLKDLGANKKKPASGGILKSAKTGGAGSSSKKSQASLVKQPSKKGTSKAASSVAKKTDTSSKPVKPMAKVKISGKKGEKSVPAPKEAKAKGQSALKLGILQKSPTSSQVLSKKSSPTRTSQPASGEGSEQKGRKSSSEVAVPKKSETGAGVGNSDYAKWQSYYKKYGNLPARDYDMSQKYEARTPIMHRSLGWGFILSIENDRLQVLFAEGIKLLISNYNPQLKL